MIETEKTEVELIRWFIYLSKKQREEVFEIYNKYLKGELK